MTSQVANASRSGRNNPSVERGRLTTHEPTAACPECDTLFERVPLGPGEAARCTDCGATVYWGPKGTLANSAALTATGLILFAIGVANPVLLLNLQGHIESASLLGAVAKLAAADMSGLASVVLVTTVLVPAMELLALAYVIFPVLVRVKAPGAIAIFRSLELLRPWAMVEVYLLGAMIALVKLASLATMETGAGIIALGALVVVNARMLATLDTAELWERLTS